MAKTWGIHNNQATINPIADEAVRIGWDQVGDLSLLEASRGAFKQALMERMPEIGTSTLPSSAGTLYRFVHEIGVGDVVVCPNRKTKTLDIGRVSGPYEYRPQNEIFPHWLPVQWIRTGVPREELSQSALEEINSATTLFRVRTAEDEIAHLLESPSFDDRPDFSWTNFYPELIDALLEYRDNRTVLLEKLQSVAQSSGRQLLFKYLQNDQYDDGGSRGPVRDIDPFTILTTFNRRIRDEARVDIAKAFKKEFLISAPAPQQFPGIPVVNNMSSWFFRWEKDRLDGEIDSLWDLCSAAVAYSLEANETTREELVAAFDAVPNKQSGRLTMGVFWTRPNHFAAYDSRNRAFLTEKYPDLAKTLTLKSALNGEQFLDNTEKVGAWLDAPDSPFSTFSEFSFAAWIDGTSIDESLEGTMASDEIHEGDVTMRPTTDEPYSVASIREDGAFTAESDLEAILERLIAKKNIILQGPPGTGKTWLARRLGWAHCNERGSSQVQVVQFHPSLTYEDFVRGWRPTGSSLELSDGPFLEMCAEARADPSRRYVLIIEEVNRGNPAQIFGELLTLMEADKRNADYAMRLAYPRGDERFFVPPNLYIIGTMNVADRSLAIVDMALRRRFAFIEIKPSFDDDWMEHVIGLGYDIELLETYGTRLKALNETITNDSVLGRQYCVGHSFFTPSTPLEETSMNTQQWWRQIIETDIRPLLEEYWFDRPDEADKASKKLLG